MSNPGPVARLRESILNDRRREQMLRSVNMSRRLTSLVAFGWSCFLAAGLLAQGATFRPATVLVPVNVRVCGWRNHPVVDLRQDDFRAFEDGKPQEIAFFESATRVSDGKSRPDGEAEAKTVLVHFYRRFVFGIRTCKRGLRSPCGPVAGHIYSRLLSSGLHQVAARLSCDHHQG